jgi:hypothetical protein
VLLQNTLAYPNIRQANAAVWSESGTLRFAQYSPGDWGTQVVDSTDDDGEVPALSLTDILGRAGWDKVDFLKCDIEGAELKVFSEARDLITRMVDCCAIELHDQAFPGCFAAVSSCFDSAAFDYSRSGEYHIYVRRTVGDTGRRVPDIHVLRATHGPRKIALTNVAAQAWGYYTFDGISCQLNANRHPGAPAELAIEISFEGQDLFDGYVMVENPSGHGVTFGLSIYDPADGRLVANASVDIAAGERRRWIFPIDALHGAYKVILRTQMMVGTPTNHQVRAYWLTPKFRAA